MAPEGVNASSVAAQCVCLEGWVGETCSQNVYVTAGLYSIIIAAGCAVLFAIFGIVVGRSLVLRANKKNHASFARIE